MRCILHRASFSGLPLYYATKKNARRERLSPGAYVKEVHIITHEKK